MNSYRPQRLTAPSLTLHAHLEIAKAMHTLIVQEADEHARRRAELCAIYRACRLPRPAGSRAFQKEFARTTMGTDQFTGILRAVVPAVVAFVAGKGWLPADTATNVGAGIVAILAAIWSWQTNVPGKIVK